MSLHRLGEHERTCAVLTDLRETMKLPAFAEDERSRAFFREAEELLGHVDNSWAAEVNYGPCFREPRRVRHAATPRYLG